MPVFKLNTYARIFIYAALFWTALGLLHVLSLSLDEPMPNRLEFLSKQRLTLFISAYFCWSFLTVFLYYLIESNPPAKNNVRWLLGLCVTTVVWLAAITLFNQLLTSLLWSEKPASVIDMLAGMPPFLYLFNFIKVLLVYSACAGIYFYRHMQESRVKLLQLERQQAEELEKRSRFQLQALQSQLSPHFLFNCLNTISSLARVQDTSAITAVIANLGGLLRYTLEATNQAQVCLDEELRFTQHYIALQQARFDGCFEFTMETALTDMTTLCPPFCLQTLVENVFAHNDLSAQEPIIIRVKLAEQQGVLSIEVENSPLQPSEYQSTGVGLGNLKERLHLLYGDAGNITTLKTSTSFKATVSFPVGHEYD